MTMLFATGITGPQPVRAAGHELVDLERELALLHAHGSLDEASDGLLRSQRALLRSESTAAYRGRQAARRLDAYEIAASTRDEQVRRRARALYKLARGGIPRFIFEDRANEFHGDEPAPQRIATTRARDARALRRVITYELEELEVYRRAQREARHELVSATRELAAHDVLRSYGKLHRDLLAAVDEAVSSSLDEHERDRRRALRSRKLDREERRLLYAVDRERREAKRQARLEARRDEALVLPDLLRPVPGDIVGGFGHYDDPVLGTPLLRNGIELVARARERVRSPAAGKVVHVGSVPGYGHVVIVDHGDELRSMVARLIDVMVEPGEVVQRGAALGRPAPPSSGAELGRTVYFELRVGEEPLDPRPWMRTH